MGSSQSAVRATHFQRPPATTTPDPNDEDEPEEHHISISNKMVERLVEDATLTGGNSSYSPTSLGDFKETIYMEKLKCLDDTHSERLGLTVDEVKALTNRIEIRTSNMVSVEPICAGCKAAVVDCYDNARAPADVVKCWDAVGAFTQCVQEASAERLRARTEREAREQERRSRHVAHAREHALKELSGAHGDSPNQ